MTTKKDAQTLPETTPEGSASPRLSLRREKVKKLMSVRSGVQTGMGCVMESMETARH
jgi:hypothetical protein